MGGGAGSSGDGLRGSPVEGTVAPSAGGETRLKQLTGGSVNAFAGVLMAFVALQMLGVALIPVVTPYLRDRFSVSDAQVGLLAATFTLAVALAAIPMGLASSRWGGRTLFLAAALFLAGSLILAAAGSFGWLLAGRFVQGLGAGAGIPVGTALITSRVAPAWRRRAFGLFGAGTGLGTVVTLLVMPGLAEAGGYQLAFVAAALVGAALLVAVATQRVLRSRPLHVETPDLRILARALGAAARSGRVLLVVAMNFTSLGAVIGIITWTPQFLHDQYGAAAATAAYLSATIGVAQIVGNPLGALVMARWEKFRMFLWCLVVTAIVTVLVPAGFSMAAALAAVLVAILLTAAVFPATLAMVGDVASTAESLGATAGLIGLANLVGSMLAPWAFGVLLDTFGTAPGDAGYVAGYAMLACFALAGAAAAAAYLFVRGRGGSAAVAIR